MQRALKFILPVVFLAVAGLLSFVMVQMRPTAMQKPPSPPALLVGVATAERSAVTFSVQSQGAVSPRTQTTLVSEVAGQITDVSSAFVSGGFFKRGDVLIRIDARNYEAALKRATAGVARARTQVATENALAGYAAEDWQRLRNLNAKSGDASDLTLRKPQLQAALADLESMEADLDKAQGDLQRTVIRAPYDGMVSEKLADIGQYVNVGSQLTRTFAVDVAEVRLPITQQDLHLLELDRLAGDGTIPVKLNANIGAEALSWEARVVRSEGVFDPASRVLFLVAQVQDPYDLRKRGAPPLRIGTFVTASIEGKSGGDLFALPRHTLTRGNVLWVLDTESRIQPRDVDVVHADEQLAYIGGGLSDGEHYVTTPIDQPLPGMKVRFDG